ncbi:hypothetical protein T552_03048 [Pneumocystis carinii B80]|uniref:RING-type domain-containing protein n=1 Tax=Pneumocystis carinii (strain B80) TaxID=1408658 RepID=A0A0W4ZCS2_PNEC8|nr:hypothetical protein T552_03048 [Pneumocystis carinii B80]KTW26156.1 hypothetical protein T552_03048 [Pneumocystis carinii B80]
MEENIRKSIYYLNEPNNINTRITKNYNKEHKEEDEKRESKSIFEKQKIISNKIENKKNISLKPENFKFNNKVEKIPLTHLLNFSYSRSFTTQLINSNYKNTKKKNIHKNDYRTKNKEYFINANYRFIVSPYEDYRPQMLDPDIPIPWKNILQILVSRLTQHSLCAICLEEDLVASRMTKCGHIFCLPCIIRYFESKNEDNNKDFKWKRCPICFDLICIMDLKPLRWYDNASPELPVEGKEILLRLFVRKQGSFFSLPWENMSKNIDSNEIPWYFEQDVLDYSRIMKASENYMIKEMNLELKELYKIKNSINTDTGFTNQSINKAIEHIQQSILSFEKISNDHKHFFETKVLTETQINIEKLNIENNALTQTKSFDDKQKINSYLFYRPQIMTHYYLSILDIKILKMAFGDYTLFPPNIIAKVENISAGHIVDDELRKRTKYLSHLPYGCEISFLECNWSNVIDESILEKFDYEIKKRQQKKREKILKEEKDSKKRYFREKNQIDLYY